MASPAPLEARAPLSEVDTLARSALHPTLDKLSSTFQPSPTKIEQNCQSIGLKQNGKGELNTRKLLGRKIITPKPILRWW